MSTQPNQDAQDGDEHKPKGYHRLANIMSRDRSTAIFRRFDELNMLHLLSLQAEIIGLQQDFTQQCQKDDQSEDDTKKQFSEYFYALHQSSGPKGQQKRMLNALRRKMAAYNRLLDEASRLAQIESPTKSNLAKLQDWLSDEHGGNCFQDGSEVRLYDLKVDRSKYIVLQPTSGENDAFTGLVIDFIVNVFHRFWGEKHPVGTLIDEESQLYSYQESRISQWTTFVATVLSSALPVVSIYILYVVKDTGKRICITIALTALFAGVLVFFSSARRAEVFAATTAFAAVEVVFIGTAIP